MSEKFQRQMEYLISKTKFVEYWNRQRFSADNMLPHFFSLFTNGCVDTVDVTTRKPVDSTHRNSKYTGKSKTCCIKCCIKCSATTKAILFTSSGLSLRLNTMAIYGKNHLMMSTFGMVWMTKIPNTAIDSRFSSVITTT